MDFLKYIFRIALFLLVCNTSYLFAASLPQQAGEQALKAAFIYNFTKFVEWPETVFPDSTTPFKICVIDVQSFSQWFHSLQNKNYKGRKVEVHQYRNSADITSCNLLFITAESDHSVVTKALQIAHKNKILTVGENENFLDQGGIIRFVTVDNRLAFEINNSLAKHVGLTISSKMLSLAKKRVE